MLQRTKNTTSPLGFLTHGTLLHRRNSFRWYRTKAERGGRRSVLTMCGHHRRGIGRVTRNAIRREIQATLLLSRSANTRTERQIDRPKESSNTHYHHRAKGVPKAQSTRIVYEKRGTLEEEVGREGGREGGEERKEKWVVVIWRRGRERDEDKLFGKGVCTALWKRQPINNNNFKKEKWAHERPTSSPKCSILIGKEEKEVISTRASALPREKREKRRKRVAVDQWKNAMVWLWLAKKEHIEI